MGLRVWKAAILVQPFFSMISRIYMAV